MTTAAAGAARRRTIPLTRAQIETPAGAELLALCREITADGLVTDEEIRRLEEWLKRQESSDLPAVAFLAASVRAILADAVVDPGERRELARDLERVLPPADRALARASRERAEQAERVAAEAAADAGDEEGVGDDESDPTYDFMVAGVRYAGRAKVIRERVRPGDQAELMRDPANAYSPHAVEVRVAGGPMVGYVPDFLAEEMAPLLDRGCAYDATFKKVLRSRDSALTPVVVVTFFEPEASEQVQRAQPSRCLALLRAADPTKPEGVACVLHRLGDALKSDLESMNGKKVGVGAVEGFVAMCGEIEPAVRQFFTRSPAPRATYEGAVVSLVTAVQDVLRQLRGPATQLKANAENDDEAARMSAVLARIDAMLGAPPTVRPPEPKADAAETREPTSAKPPSPVSLPVIIVLLGAVAALAVWALLRTH